MNDKKNQMIEEMRKNFVEKSGQVILVFVSHSFQPRRIKYLFTKWETFEKHLPFSDIDPMYTVNFEMWEDGDSI